MTFGDRVAATWPLREVSGASGFHWPPYGRDSSVTLRTPRASPARRVDAPKTTGAAGGVKFSMPIVNHVERIPSAARAAAPVMVRSPFVPITVKVRTRPDAAASVLMSTTLPRAPSRRPSTAGVNRSGPQSWYGESVS